MVLSIAYRLVRCLLGLLAVLARSELSKDAELLVPNAENIVDPLAGLISRARQREDVDVVSTASSVPPAEKHYVTCYTCHRGSRLPLTEPAAVAAR